MKRLLVFVLMVLPCVAATAAGRPPNIIFILADDLGWGDLGCYGQKRIKTPHLDRIAAEGMRFTSAYAGSTVCAPSRCALMTGLHTGHTRIRGNAKLPLAPEDVTVAEVLKGAGYRTAHFGKWGLGLENTTGAPRRQGFDEFFGYLDQTHAHNYYPDFLWRNEQQFLMPKNQNGGRGDYAPDWFTRAALNYIRLEQTNAFFLYLACITPHANNERQRSQQDGMEVPDDAPYSKENWPQAEKNKAAMITRMDADIGRILDRLRELKIDEQTVIFFSSDNGPHKEGGNDPEFFDSNGPFRGIKRDLAEGGIRVPFLVRWPGRIPAGKVSEQPVAFWDFLATAAELAGAPAPKTDGVSIVPTLLGRAPAKVADHLYWEFHERGFQQAVRLGDWKGLRSGDGATALYNLKNDPGETDDVARINPKLVAKIEAIMTTARTESDRWPSAGSAPKSKTRKKQDAK